jgi:hypothetical protein
LPHRQWHSTPLDFPGVCRPDAVAQGSNAAEIVADTPQIGRVPRIRIRCFPLWGKDGSLVTDAVDGAGATSIARCLSLTDAVEKRFCSSERARLIQDQAPMRNLDSKIYSPRFDCCVFLFYSLSAATFSTTSTLLGHHTQPFPMC